jgi:RNA polymerase sigma factor (sigma-70 family)
MAATKRRVSALSEIDLLPADFRKDLPDENAESARLWRRWLANRDQAAFDALWVRYLPVARMIARTMKRRRPDYYREPVADLISDGALGVMETIRGQTVYEPEFTLARFFWRVPRYIRRCVCNRFWAGGGCRRKLDELEHLRSALTCDLGRVPDRAELLAELGKTITNPNIVIDVPAMRRPPDFPLKDESDSPERPVIDADLRRFVMQRLDKRDRRIFRMLMKGLTPTEIAVELGISRQRGHQLVNGLLWTLRCEKRVAAALGMEPSKRPRGSKTSLPAIASRGPARLVG